MKTIAQQTQLETPLAGALYMAQLGFSVFPLQAGSKKPFEVDTCEPKHRPLAGGINRATRDAGKIRRWAAVDPDICINFGVSTHDLVVIDIDTKHDVERGIEEMLALELPRTFTVTTPSGGAHAYFKGPPTGQSKLGKCIDVRSRGGYVVAPGSRIDGQPYVIQADGAVAELPGEVRAKIGKASARDRQINRAPACDLDLAHNVERAKLAASAFEPADEGGRNNAAFNYACWLKDLGVSEQMAHELMISWNSRNSQPLDDDELQSAVANAFDHGQNQPGCRTPEAEFADIQAALGEIGLQQTQTGQTDAVSLARFLGRIQSLADGRKDVGSRPWIAHARLLRKQVTQLVAPGGVGKSLLGLIWAVALARGDGGFIGLDVRGGPKRVLLVNLEDDADEMHRRLDAVLDHYGIAEGELGDRLNFYNSDDDSGNGFKLVIRRQRQLAPGEDLKHLHHAVEALKIDAVILDPLVEMHDAVENDNGEIARVMAAIRGVARRHAAAVLVVHHTSKPPIAAAESYAGNPNAGRGASAGVNASRISLTLFNMTKGEAKALGVPETERHLFARLDNAKGNYTAPTASAQWFKRVTVRLDCGEDVGVYEPADFAKFERARALADFVPAAMRELINAGQNLSPNPKANNNVGRVLSALSEERGGPKFEIGEIEGQIDVLVGFGLVEIEEYGRKGAKPAQRYRIVDHAPGAIGSREDDNEEGAAA